MGAVLQGRAVTGFGDGEAERRAMAGGTSVHPLGDEAILRASGTDASSFLQSQFSNDVSLLGSDNAQWTSYCTAQGRVLAMPLAWKDGPDMLLWMPAEIANSVTARLRRYVLRAKVELTDVSEAFAVFGLGGPATAPALHAVSDEVPARPMQRTQGSRGETLIMLAAELFIVVSPAAQAAATWEALAQRCTPAGEPAWHWRLVQAGIPRLGAALQDQFVPQMLNLERIGAISFDKGCYPGQEIVARSQYLGQVKRRLALLHAAQGPARVGQPIVRSDGSVAGTVVNAAPAPSGGWDLLAVVFTDAIAATGLRLDAADGDPVRPG
jgi:folate-binding protein YgfZ